MSAPTEPAKREPAKALHLWQIAAVREAFWLAIIVLLIWSAYVLRALLAPLLIALALAYVADPAIRGLQRRARAPRVVTACAMLLLILAAVSGFVIWLLPRLIVQLTQLSEQLPVYWEALQRQYERWEGALTSAPINADSAVGTIQADSVIQGAYGSVGPLFGVLGSAVGTAGFLVVAAVLIPILFVYFATYFDRLASLKWYLPASRRDRILELLRGVDAAFSGYVRGQLVVALFTTAGFCIGFYLVDVPYWFVVALIGGVLSLVPYGQMSGWLLAMTLKYAEAQTGPNAFSWFGILIAPSLVYAVTQSMESWVITPLVQGEATNLHPVVVLVALIIGGALAGIVGLVLAVPVTASAKMLIRELAGPRLKHWADTH